MARPSSKIMSLAEKKTAQAGLKTALKAHSESVKGLAAEAKAAKAAFDAAVKAANAPVTTLEKELAAAFKARDKAVKEAQKTFDSAMTKNAKLQAAAEKGAAKLNEQSAALDAVVTAPKAIASAAIAKASAQEAVAA